MKTTLILAALLTLSGCATRPQTPEERAFWLQYMQNQQAQQQQLMRDIATPSYQIVQPQPIQMQAPMLRGPTTTNCVRQANSVNCVSY